MPASANSSWLRWILYSLALAATAVLFRNSLLASPDNGFTLADPLVPRADIHHGGPPRDGIPALTRPGFINARVATFLSAEDRVLGLSRNGEHKAYPVKILNYPEIVNDRFGDETIVISYCPLCGTGMAFLATIDGQAHEFGVSGLLYNSDMLLYDRETESLWSQIMRRAISGPLRGKHLTQVPLTHTTWDDWRQQHPATRVLSRDTGHAVDYSRSPYPGYATNRALYFGVTSIDPRYHPKEQVIGLSIDGHSKAWPFSELAVAGHRLRDQLAGKVLQLEFDAANRSGRILDADGQELPSTIAYWFAWMAFHPQSAVFQAPPALASPP